MRSSAEFNPDSNTAVLTLEFREEEILPYVDEVLRRLQRQARVPGFRQGKVPRSVLLSRVGGEAMRADAIEDAVQEHYETAVVENGLDPIGQPSLKVLSGQASGDVSVAIDLQLRPRVSVVGWDAIEVQVPAIAATDKDIEEVLNSIREQMATVKEVERPIQDSDQVTVNVIEVREDGTEEVVTPYLTVRVGRGELGGEEEEALIGASVGDKISSSHGGEPRIYEILAVRELELPEVNDDFAKLVSEFETSAELMADIRSTFSLRRKQEAKNAFEQGVYSALLELVSPKEIPEALLSSAYQKEIHDFGHVLDGSGISLHRFLEMSQQDESDLARSLSNKAGQEVLWDLALRAVAFDAALEVADEELALELERLLGERGADREQLLKPMQQAQVRAGLLKQKAFRELMARAKALNPDGIQLSLEELGLASLLEPVAQGSGDGADTGLAPAVQEASEEAP